MSAPIFNRDEFQHPGDGWYQIEAKGDHPNRASGVVQIIDDEAAQSIVNRFNADAAAGKLRHGKEMLIDHEHFSDQPDQETRAYGWLEQLQNRSDGIYGKIRWTATGQTAVDGGDYRFFSTEYSPRDLKVLNASDPKQVRPMRLDGLTLTNMNNNRGQKPITNRAIPTPIEKANDKAHQSEIEAGYPAPDLEKWFTAVDSMKKAMWNKMPQMTFQQAWLLCKNQHPDLYISAFGSLSANPYSDPAAPESADEQEAANETAKLVNRVQSAAGCTFRDAWEFVRREAPVIFNRMSRASNAVQNRKGLSLSTPAEKSHDNEDRARAGIYLRKLAEEEKKAGIPFDLAFARVCNREAALNSLMCGRLTGSQVFAVHPELLSKIYGA